MKLKIEKPIFEIPILDKKGNRIAMVKASPMSPKELNDLIMQSKKVVWERGQRFEESDLYAYRAGKIDKTILDWQGFEDENGHPLECNFKNKELVNAMYPIIIDFNFSEIEKLQKEITDQIEIEIKN